MRYDSPELKRQLAAEYVIGTLRGAARRRFETLLETDEEARFQRDFWEQRLAEFGQVLTPVSPPMAARAELLRLTASPATQNPVLKPALFGGRRRRRTIWAYAAGFAGAASLALAFLVGQRYAVLPDSGKPLRTGRSPIAVAVIADEPPREAWPIYAAEMRMPASSMGWLLSLTPDHERLIAVAADDFYQSGRAQLQLWCMVPGADPVWVGMLPSEKDQSATFVIPPSVRGREQVSFAITLEPIQPQAGTQRVRKPSAPVLNESATLIDKI